MECFYKLGSSSWYIQHEKDMNTFTITVLLPLPHLPAKGKRQQVLIQMKPELGKTSHNGYKEYFCKEKKRLFSWAAGSTQTAGAPRLQHNVQRRSSNQPSTLVMPPLRERGETFVAAPPAWLSAGRSHMVVLYMLMIPN